jgi:peptidoglycan/LPS O-acetylase OafA/YrhL
MPKTPPTHRLAAIEGLRGYLAMMVLIGHVFIFGAYIHIPNYFHRHLGGILNALDRGGLAVNCFMIVSGFVIFMLIDRKKEPYRVFILRRFLRIFPVYFVLLMLAFPCQWVAGLTLGLTRHFQDAAAIQKTQQAYDALWSNFWIHLPLHLTMLQGVVSKEFLPDSSTAFLGPAWSLSLEWQFYLLAPLWCALFLTKIPWQRLLMYGVCLYLVFKSNSLFSTIDEGAFLPLQLPFFLTGIVSYFIYAAVGHVKLKGDILFPAGILIGLGAYRLALKPLAIVPFLAWGVLFALLLEPEDSLSCRFVGPIFTNRISLWLGKISYSIYLSHSLVLILLQYLVLRLFPGITQGELLWTLLLATPAVTLPFSDFLYRTIEAPFIERGKRITGESTVVITDIKGRPA